MCIVPVGNKALETADADRLTLDAAGADALALSLLRTYTAADRRQRGREADDLVCAFKVALGNLGDKFGDMNVDGAAVHTGTVLAAEAALCLVDGGLLGIAERDLLKVLVADIGCLRRHRILLRAHIELRHLT